MDKHPVIQAVCSAGKPCTEVWDRAPAYRFSLSRDSSAILQEGGEVRFAWNAHGLYVRAELEDSCLIAKNRQDEQLHYLHGDVFELFLKPLNKSYKWEMYATPAGNKSTLFFPSWPPERSAEECLWDHNFRGLDVWVEETAIGWTAQMFVPSGQLTALGAAWGPGSEWTVFCGRYNYNSEDLETPELSMVPTLSKTNYHLIEEYAILEFLGSNTESINGGKRMKPTLVIMAAGIGSRYGGLKQIDPVGPSGEIVLDYSIYDAIQAGFGKVVFIIRPEIEADFKEAIGNKLEGKIDVEYVFQTLEGIPEGFSVPKGRTKPWGTGQAVLSAASVVNEPFAVINADDFYGRETFDVLSRQLSETDPKSTDFCMVGFYIKNTLSSHGGVARGYCNVSEGKLKTVIERFEIERKKDGIIRYVEDGELRKMADDDLVSMNAWGFTPQLFGFLKCGFVDFLTRYGSELKSEYLLPEVIDKMICNGESAVDVLTTNEKWMGVTYPEDKPQVVAGIRRLVTAGCYPENLWG